MDNMECEADNYKTSMIFLMRPYVYEVIDGKRKRVSPFVVKDGIVTEIKQRGIISRIK
jgi:hypothetical protein